MEICRLLNANFIEFRKRLRFIKALVYQMPLVQLVIIVLTALLVEAQVIQRGSVSAIFEFDSFEMFQFKSKK